MTRLIFISIIGLLASCTQNDDEKEHLHETKNTQELVLTSEQLEVNEYKIGKPILSSFNTSVNFTGVVDLPPSNRYIISNYIAGYVKKINVIVGDHVKKGQVIASIEHQGILELQEKYLKVESEKEYLEQEYERLKKLFEDNVVSKKEFISAKSKFNSIAAQLESLKGQLILINLSPEKVKPNRISRSYPILAPSNGIISSVNAATGEWVGNDKQLMSLVDPDHIHLELQVFAKDVARLIEGQSLNFGMHGDSEEEFTATVYRIGAEVKEDRRVLVHAHPDSVPDQMIIGSYVNGTINVNSDSLFALPATAVTELDGNNYVLIQKDKHNGEVHFERTEVKVLHKKNGWVAIDTKLRDRFFLLNGTFDLIKPDGGNTGGHSH